MERGGPAPVKSVKLGLSQIEAPWGAAPPPSNLRCAEWQGPSNLWRAGGPWAPVKVRGVGPGPARQIASRELWGRAPCQNGGSVLGPSLSNHVAVALIETKAGWEIEIGDYIWSMVYTVRRERGHVR